MLSYKLRHAFSLRKRLNSPIAWYTNRNRYATATSTSIDETKRVYEHFKVGHSYHGFLVKQIEVVPEFSIQAIHLTHEQTNAEYLHLFREDTNNVFSINFRTTPLDSTGLPHILEHTVLCGSSLYPVRDPFFKMLNRSLATFMNALTGPDYTLYPFSTTNIADYKNLQSVYLDAVFRPNLRLQDFMQEGWRLEHSDLANEASDLIIKGVVYNEMKGCFAENERIFGQELLNSILPDHTYGVISGGDPLKIPMLTWEDLKEFHRQHYHPSNCRFYSYGNFPLLPTLELLDRKYLHNIYSIDTNHTEVPSQPRWSTPKTKSIACRFENIGASIEKQNTIAISYALCDIRNVYETFLLQFLTELLIRGPNSPFYKSLIEPNISGGYSPSTGYDGCTKDTIFILGLQGLEKSKFDEVIKIFDDTIDSVVQNGFDSEQIESVLHSYELRIKHETRNFGLNFLFSLASLWNHNGPIIDALKINELIVKLRSNLAKNPRYLQQKVDEHFKQNKHRLVLTMSPDVNYEQNMIEEEQKLLEEKVKNLSKEEKKEIFTLGHELQAEQSKVQNMDILPTLTLGDINREVTRTFLENETFKQVPTQLCAIPTNGITYFQSIISTAHLRDDEQIMLLPLFNYVISMLGTPSYDYRHFDTLISKKTSGLSLDMHVVENLNDFNLYEKGIRISSYCLDKNVADMLAIWNEIFNIRKLTDVKRFEMLLDSYVANLTHGIADQGHMYANRAANSLISGPALQKELFFGLRHVDYMKKLATRMNHEEILSKINEIAMLVFNRNNIRSALNFMPENREIVALEFNKFLNSLPGQPTKESNQIKWLRKDIAVRNDKVQCQHNVLNIPVHFCARSIRTVPFVDGKYAALKVLAKLLSAKYLHPIVREKNGAYGGGAKLNSDGMFGFYSYRDPNNVKTLDVFEESHEFVLDNLESMTDQDIFEAKLGLFQAIDAPIVPENRGDNAFLLGLTDEMLQKHRLQILDVKRDDLRRVSGEFLAKHTASPTANVIIGPKSLNADLSKRPRESWSVENCD